MLHKFLTDHRDSILDRARTRVGKRTAPRPTEEELAVAIPLFLDELIETLGGADRSAKLDRDATLHGGRRQQLGFTIAQVVHDYGDICQAVTQLLVERDVPINNADFGTLNLVLDNAIAHAVTEHSRTREHTISQEENHRLGFLAHELRDNLNTAVLAFDVLKTGTVAIGGSTGAVLERSLASLRSLIDRSLTQVRLDAGIEHREKIEISVFLEEIEAAGVVTARSRGMSLSVARGKRGVWIVGDRQLLGSAVSNLLSNGFKYSREGGHVILRATATAGRVTIEVEDECGGLADGQFDAMFEGVQKQTAGDKSGMGFGLLISKRAIESLGGTLRAENRGGSGCVFAIELPRAIPDGLAKAS